MLSLRTLRSPAPQHTRSAKATKEGVTEAGERRGLEEHRVVRLL